MDKSNRIPQPGDLVNVLISETDMKTGGKKFDWKAGVLLNYPEKINFDDLLWVEVLIDGKKITTTPGNIELN